MYTIRDTFIAQVLCRIFVEYLVLGPWVHRFVRMASGQEGNTQQFTMQWLKELLRERDLVVTGSKAESIARLLQANPHFTKFLVTGTGGNNTAPLEESIERW